MVNDSIVVEVKITLYKVVPPVEVATQTSKLESYFNGFSENINATGSLPPSNGLTSGKEMTGSSFEGPRLDDVEKAKDSLKEYLSDLIKLNMRDRLSSALSTLSHAQVGLSPGQYTMIETFKVNFDDFVYDFLTFEQGKSDLELQKLSMNNIHSMMKKEHETHLSYKQLFDELAREKEDLNRKLKELSNRQVKLISNWETLMNESKDLNNRRLAQEEKFVEAEKKMKVAEEKMSRSTNAWLGLKEEFLWNDGLPSKL